jgi:hypothetical protein
VKSKPGAGITLLGGWITLLGTVEDVERYELFEETPAQWLERRRMARDSPEPAQAQRSPSRVPGAPAR